MEDIAVKVKSQRDKLEARRRVLSKINSNSDEPQSKEDWQEVTRKRNHHKNNNQKAVNKSSAKETTNSLKVLQDQNLEDSQTTPTMVNSPRREVVENKSDKDAEHIATINAMRVQLKKEKFSHLSLASKLKKT